jgi:DNA-binding XRE family transcriptional regulator
MKVGVELKRIREESGLSQARFAKLLGFSRTSLINWENGAVSSYPESVFNFILQNNLCTQCKGNGVIACPSCEGKGLL